MADWGGGGGDDLSKIGEGSKKSTVDRVPLKCVKVQITQLIL